MTKIIANISRTRLLEFLSVVLLVTTFVGCGKDKTYDAEILATSQESYDQAIEQLAEDNTEAALGLLDVALQPGGGLTPDIHVDARVKRAIVHAKLEHFEDAHSDLDVAAQGAADMSAVHVARSFVFSKEGKSKESKTEMSLAKKLNKSAKAIRD